MTGFVLILEGKNDRKVLWNGDGRVLRGGGAWSVEGKSKSFFFIEVKVQRSLSCDDWLSDSYRTPIVPVVPLPSPLHPSYPRRTPIIRILICSVS